MTKSSLSIWRLLHSVKSTVKISSIFVAFLENMNFKNKAILQNGKSIFSNYVRIRIDYYGFLLFYPKNLFLSDKSETSTLIYLSFICDKSINRAKVLLLFEWNSNQLVNLILLNVAILQLLKTTNGIFKGPSNENGKINCPAIPLIIIF